MVLHSYFEENINNSANTQHVNLNKLTGINSAYIIAEQLGVFFFFFAGAKAVMLGHQTAASCDQDTLIYTPACPFQHTGP